jgi:hypothetical protein
MSIDGLIRNTRDIVRGIEATPDARKQFEHFDRWQWWMMQHGMRLIGANLNQWQAASLECIVRHSTEDGIPVRWLFEGGPDGKDERLKRPSCRGDSHRRELDRLLEKLEPLYKKLELDFRVKKDDGMRERVVFTAAHTVQTTNISRPRR